MDWITEFQTLLAKTIEQGRLAEARALVQGFHRTKAPFNAGLCYLEALLCFEERRYPLALFWAEQGLGLDRAYAPLQQLRARLLLLAPGDSGSPPKPPAYPPGISCLVKTLRIIVVEGPLAIVNYTARQFRAAFEALGHEVFVLDTGQIPDILPAFGEFCAKGVDFALTFNNLSLSLCLENGENLWDFLDVPCFDYMFDHPLYFFDTFNDPPARAVVTCVDRRHVDYLRRFYPKIKNAFFLPLGGEELAASRETAGNQNPVSFGEFSDAKPRPWRERPLQALYVGSLKKAPHALSDGFSGRVANLLCQQTHLTVEAAVERCLFSLAGQEFASLFPEEKKAGYPAPSEDVLKGILEKYRYCDLNINSFFRENLIRVLVNAGIHVNVYGQGWESCDFFHHPCFHFGGLLSQEACLCRMRNARFVLNSMPWFKDGAHDRIYNAMLSRALCVTDPSLYLREEFRDGEDIVFYSLDRMEELPGLIRHYEAHPGQAEAIIDKGYRKTALAHTWPNRAMSLLENFYFFFSSRPL